MKKILSLVLALAMVMGIGFEAFADNTVDGESGEGTTNLTITAAATQLSATVPTALAIDVNNQSDATVGVGSIINNSYGIIEVKSITLTNGTYSLAAYTTKPEFMRYDVGSRRLGLSIAFGGATVESKQEMTYPAVTYITGTDFNSGVAKNLPVGNLRIGAYQNGDKSNTLKIVPSAFVSPTGSVAIEEAEIAASMLIVVGWYTGS